MEHRTLELNLESAKDLKDLNIFSKMDVYAVLSLSGDQKTKTPVDRNGGTNPTWNFPVKFTFDESEARQNRLAIEIKIRSERALATDKDIGQVHVPLMELLKQPGDGKSFQHVSYQVRKPSGKPKGALNFSYKFGDKFTAPAKVSAPAPASVSHKVEPLTAYPTPAMGSTSSAAYPAVYPPPPPQYAYPPPPPQPAHGYGYAPQHGYGYAPQAAYGYAPQAAYGYAPQPGYGYAPPPPAAAVQRPGKNNFGMGLGAGLLGGALGGLLIGDMISDAGSYDAGFGDVGGFDF